MKLLFMTQKILFMFEINKKELYIQLYVVTRNDNYYIMFLCEFKVFVIIIRCDFIINMRIKCNLLTYASIVQRFSRFLLNCGKYYEWINVFSIYRKNSCLLLPSQRILYTFACIVTKHMTKCFVYYWVYYFSFSVVKCILQFNALFVVFVLFILSPLYHFGPSSRIV